jgi:hypothetical protein
VTEGVLTPLLSNSGLVSSSEIVGSSETNRLTRVLRSGFTSLEEISGEVRIPGVGRPTGSLRGDLVWETAA